MQSVWCILTLKNSRQTTSSIFCHLSTCVEMLTRMLRVWSPHPQLRDEIIERFLRNNFFLENILRNTVQFWEYIKYANICGVLLEESIVGLIVVL